MNIYEISLLKKYVDGQNIQGFYGIFKTQQIKKTVDVFSKGPLNIIKSFVNAISFSVGTPLYVAKNKYSEVLNSKVSILNKGYAFIVSTVRCLFSILISCSGYYFFVCLCFKMFCKEVSEEEKIIEEKKAYSPKASSIPSLPRKVAVPPSQEPSELPPRSQPAPAPTIDHEARAKFEALVRAQLPPEGTEGYKLFADPIMDPEGDDANTEGYLNVFTYKNGVIDVNSEKFYPLKYCYYKSPVGKFNCYITKFQFVAIRDPSNNYKLFACRRKFVKMTLSNGEVRGIKIMQGEYENGAFTDKKGVYKPE